jgi:hypothetical protein
MKDEKLSQEAESIRNRQDEDCSIIVLCLAEDESVRFGVATGGPLSAAVLEEAMERLVERWDLRGEL